MALIPLGGVVFGEAPSVAEHKLLKTPIEWGGCRGGVAYLRGSSWSGASAGRTWRETFCWGPRA